MTEQKDHLEPIKKMAEASGVKMPDMVATGDLTVEKNDEQVDEKELKMIPLPAIGTKFMVDGHEYKVVYINEGKGRFSCERCKGVY